MYLTNYTIIDTKDNNRYYRKGDQYPADGAKVSKKRIEELLSKGHIKNELENLTVKDLKALAKEKGLENYSELKKEELIQLIRE